MEIFLLIHFILRCSTLGDHLEIENQYGSGGVLKIKDTSSLVNVQIFFILLFLLLIHPVSFIFSFITFFYQVHLIFYF